MARSEEIMKKGPGTDYSQFESGSIAFDYEKLMAAAGYDLQEVIAMQKETGVGGTPFAGAQKYHSLCQKVRQTRLRSQNPHKGRGRQSVRLFQGQAGFHRRRTGEKSWVMRASSLQPPETTGRQSPPRPLCGA